jgi:hypothetical protein
VFGIIILPDFTFASSFHESPFPGSARDIFRHFFVKDLVECTEEPFSCFCSPDMMRVSV